MNELSAHERRLLGAFALFVNSHLVKSSSVPRFNALLDAGHQSTINRPARCFRKHPGGLCDYRRVEAAHPRAWWGSLGRL